MPQGLRLPDRPSGRAVASVLDHAAREQPDRMPQTRGEQKVTQEEKGMRGTIMVNSLYDLFDAPGAKPDAEQLIVNGRYMLPPIGDRTGKRRSLQRVTNFIKQISDTEALTKWRLRQVVLGLALS